MSITTVLGNAFGVFIFQTGIASLTIKELTFIVVNLKLRSNEMTQEDAYALGNIIHQEVITFYESQFNEIFKKCNIYPQYRSFRGNTNIRSKLINLIYNDHEAQFKAKDDEIRRLNNLYADTIKDLGDALIEIERLKVDLNHLLKELGGKHSGGTNNKDIQWLISSKNTVQAL